MKGLENVKVEVVKRHDVDIRDYYRQLDLKDKEGKLYKHDVFDYDAIWDDEIPMFLIISERGAKGKSTQAKRLMRRIWTDEKLRSLWVMNTDKLIKKEKKSHLTKPLQYLRDIFTGEERKSGDTILAKMGDVESWYTRFVPLSIAENEKGSRDDYGLMIYDEFNIGLRQIRKQQVDLFSSLIATADDPINVSEDKFKKLIIHGNNKSLNNEVLISLGLRSLSAEVTDVTVDGFTLLRVLSPIMSEEDRKKIKNVNSNNWKFKLQQALGKADHVYFNDNLFDEINNVNSWMYTVPERGFYYIKIDDKYFRVSVREPKDVEKYTRAVIYITEETRDSVKKTEQTVYAINKQDVTEGIVLNTNFKKNLLKQIYLDNMYFGEIYIRETIIPALTK